MTFPICTHRSVVVDTLFTLVGRHATPVCPHRSVVAGILSHMVRPACATDLHRYRLAFLEPCMGFRNACTKLDITLYVPGSIDVSVHRTKSDGFLPTKPNISSRGLRKKKSAGQKLPTCTCPPIPRQQCWVVALEPTWPQERTFFPQRQNARLLPTLDIGGKGGKCMGRQRYTRADFFFSQTPDPSSWV